LAFAGYIPIRVLKVGHADAFFPHNSNFHRSNSNTARPTHPSGKSAYRCMPATRLAVLVSSMSASASKPLPTRHGQDTGTNHTDSSERAWHDKAMLTARLIFISDTAFISMQHQYFSHAAFHLCIPRLQLQHRVLQAIITLHYSVSGDLPASSTFGKHYSALNQQHQAFPSIVL
jgi:hypothetical protein